jgi:hypothetical protein
MKQLDILSPTELDTLRLKGMLSSNNRPLKHCKCGYYGGNLPLHLEHAATQLSAYYPTRVGELNVLHGEVK